MGLVMQYTQYTQYTLASLAAVPHSRRGLGLVSCSPPLPVSSCFHHKMMAAKGWTTYMVSISIYLYIYSIYGIYIYLSIYLSIHSIYGIYRYLHILRTGSMRAAWKYRYSKCWRQYVHTKVLYIIRKTCTFLLAHTLQRLQCRRRAWLHPKREVTTHKTQYLHFVRVTSTWQIDSSVSCNKTPKYRCKRTCVYYIYLLRIHAQQINKHA